MQPGVLPGLRCTSCRPLHSTARRTPRQRSITFCPHAAQSSHVSYTPQRALVLNVHPKAHVSQRWLGTIRSRCTTRPKAASSETSSAEWHYGSGAQPAFSQTDASQTTSWWRGLIRFLKMALCFAVAAAVTLFRSPTAYAAEISPRRGADVAMVADASNSASCSGRGYRDTGIQLAAAGEEPKTALQEPSKKIKHPFQSRVPDPAGIPDDTDPRMESIMSKYRTDRLRNLDYTQLWFLIEENRVDKVVMSVDDSYAMVTTKANAPGGVRTEKVGMPFDPMFHDHCLEHGVDIVSTDRNPTQDILWKFARLAAPFYFAIFLVRLSFRLGRKKRRDQLLGGARLELITSKDTPITFADVAGIDEVKGEVLEAVEFLRDPDRFLSKGCRTPGGILMVGPPGVGKTLLAKAIAGESQVPFFSIAGTDFTEMFVGVGASRVRDMFERARKNAPCILFIDEFDGIGKARGSGGQGSEESVQTINQLLTELDGFEDNTGIIVMAATNRPSTLDQALIRPGRFDRIIHLPFPSLKGRMEILKVHARNKRVSPELNYNRISRATAGFTGADLMDLMNRAAVASVKAGHEEVVEEDVFQALEELQLEKAAEAGADASAATAADGQSLVPPEMRRNIAVYEAGRALIGCITPNFDELAKVSVCPNGTPTGFTYFIPREEHLESHVVMRGYLESKMAVAMAGRAAERLLLGSAYISSAGVSDVEAANNTAREMVLRYGFSRRLAPVSLMDDVQDYLNLNRTRAIANVSPETADLALRDIQDLLDAADAKATYGLTVNYDALRALVSRLETESSMTNEQVSEVLLENDVMLFRTPNLDGFGWDPSGRLIYRKDYPGVEYAFRLRRSGVQSLREQQAMMPHRASVPLEERDPRPGPQPYGLEQLLADNLPRTSTLVQPAAAAKPAAEAGSNGTHAGA